MDLISEIAGEKASYDFLKYLKEKNLVIGTRELSNLMDKINLEEETFLKLIKGGLLIESPIGFYLSSLGERTTLLLKAINNEEEILEIYRQLKEIYPFLSLYELITENVTDYFIDSLVARPDFIRLYICSPWIRLSSVHIDRIRLSLNRASNNYKQLQFFIITLPVNRYKDDNALKTLKLLKDIGAYIVTNTRVHTKLYISEPGPLGGNHYAILGSENLTGRGNIELAIKIQNDNEILRKLSLYFNNIFYNSEELKEV